MFVLCVVYCIINYCSDGYVGGAKVSDCIISIFAHILQDFYTTILNSGSISKRSYLPVLLLLGRCVTMYIVCVLLYVFIREYERKCCLCL